MVDDRIKEDGMWDASSREESEKNYVLGQTMSNPWNNTNNPNWRNYILKDGFRREKINDPQRVEERNRVQDTNYNKDLITRDKKKKV